MLKKIIFLLVFFLIIPVIFTSAYLGIYEISETLTYSVVCLEDGGKRDSGCSTPGVYILGPNDNTPIENSSFFTEVDDDLMPGLWRGNYTVGSGNQTGLWSIYINLTNSNSTPSATVLHFQVVGSTYGIESIGSNVGTAVSNQAVIQADLRTLNSSILNRIGNPLGNSTTLWDYMWGSLTDTSTTNLLYRIWQYAWRTTSGVQT